MSDTSLPTINSLIDVVVHDGEAFHSRVEDVTGKRLTVGAPFGIHADEIPKIGGPLEVAWLAGDRRLMVEAKLTRLTREPAHWELEAISAPRLETRRHFVRGGGGERVVLARGDDSYAGWAIDVSEGGVRCRMPVDTLRRDERVEVRLTLDTELLTLLGLVKFVRPHEETSGYDVVVIYQTSEAVGRLIRGYIMRREMEQRRRLRAGV